MIASGLKHCNIQGIVINLVTGLEEIVANCARSGELWNKFLWCGFKDVEQAERVPFIKTIIDNVDHLVAEYLQNRPRPAPPTKAIIQAAASSTLVNTERAIGFPADLSELRVASPRQGDGTTPQSRLSYRLPAGPSLKRIDPLTQLHHPPLMVAHPEAGGGVVHLGSQMATVPD